MAWSKAAARPHPDWRPNLAVFPAVGYTPIMEELGEGVGAAGDEQPGLNRGERRPRVTRHTERPRRAPAGAATAAAPLLRLEEQGGRG